MLQETSGKFLDTFFRYFFRDEIRALELYSAIVGEKILGKVKIYDDGGFWARQNDLLFIVNSQLIVMCEHQSTLSPNMPLRLLLYFSLILGAQVFGDKMVYGKSPIKIPTPKFYVLYNGEEKLHDQILKLSDTFLLQNEEVMLEATVKVININWEEGKPILSRSPSLEGYAYLIAELRKNILLGMDRDRAIGKAIETCIEKGKIAEFLKGRFEEVAAMLNFEYSQERCDEVMRQEGREEEKSETVIQMRTEGFDDEVISRITKLPIEKIHEIFSTNN